MNIDIDPKQYEEYIKSLEDIKKNPMFQSLVSIFSEDDVDPKKIEDLQNSIKESQPPE